MFTILQFCILDIICNYNKSKSNLHENLFYLICKLDNFFLLKIIDKIECYFLFLEGGRSPCGLFTH